MSAFKLALTFVIGGALGAYSSVVYLSDRIRGLEGELRDIAADTIQIGEEVEALAAIDRLDSAMKIARNMAHVYREGEFNPRYAREVAALVRQEAEALRLVEGLSLSRRQRANQLLSLADDLILDLEFYQ